MRLPRGLKPFWRYYGGKWRAAPKYPAPTHSVIVEPFAGAAGYSMRYPDRHVVLIERDPVIAGIWRYLIGVSATEIRRIPLVDAVDELPSWVPKEARDLVGFTMNAATTGPRRCLSAGRRKMRDSGRVFEGWSMAMRDRVATQVDSIRHWRLIEADYAVVDFGDNEATWFVDPPYNNKAGSYYRYSTVDYTRLAAWCRSRRGQVIVCENEGADWLPFKPFMTFKPGLNNVSGGSREVIWTND